jgi:hypothetical protein
MRAFCSFAKVLLAVMRSFSKVLLLASDTCPGMMQ